MLPRSGREVPEYNATDLREVAEGSYRVIYRIKDGQIDMERHRSTSNPARLGKAVSRASYGSAPAVVSTAMPSAWRRRSNWPKP